MSGHPDPHLSRNMNGDLLLIQDGEPNEIVATSFSPLWKAILASMKDKATPVPHVSDERIMDLWNEAIDKDGSNIPRFARLLIQEVTKGTQ
jgi:hypothetical protein